MVPNSDAASYKEVVLMLVNCFFVCFFLGPCLAFCCIFLVYHSC